MVQVYKARHGCMPFATVPLRSDSSRGESQIQCSAKVQTQEGKAEGRRGGESPDS